MLESLVSYYEYLLEHHPDRVSAPGWSPTRVSAFIELDQEGNFVGVILAADKRGEERKVPKQIERSVNVAPNLLCDNSSYILGIDKKGKPKRALECFAKSRDLHLEELSAIDSPAAKAVLGFFEKWDPSDADTNQLIIDHADDVLAGRNLAFMVKGAEVLSDPAVMEYVSSRSLKGDGEDEMVSLVSGKKQSVARLHPKIKLPGAQAGGGVLVGFNASAFTSYGHDDDQGLNSPISEYEAFAYTTALNYLIRQPEHHIRIDDTTIVYWALEDDDECADLFQSAVALRAFPKAADIEEHEGAINRREDQGKKLDEVMKAIEKGSIPGNANANAPFFVLGISPNAARISVRFFVADSFGHFLGNIVDHYQRLDIAHAPHEKGLLSVNRLIWETQNPKAQWSKASNILAASLLQSILTNARYPEMLFQQAMMRIRSTQSDEETHVRKVDYGRAAIIKAYLIKNCNVSKEELTVELNDGRNTVAYNLGRLFAVLEKLQEHAAWIDGRKLNATIVDRYFNSACATPVVAFPTLCKLGMAHLAKLRKKGQAGSLAELMGKINERIHQECGHYPSRLNNEEQGDFILGYWCQRQAFFGANNEQKVEG